MTEPFPGYNKALAEGRITEKKMGPIPEGKPVRLAEDKPSKKVPGKLIEPAFRVSERNEQPWIEFDLPLRLEPTTNHGVFKKWMLGQAAKHRREVFRALAAKIEHVAAYVMLAQKGHGIDCTFTRIGRSMDDDNLSPTCKYVRDAVALYLGVDDGRKGPIRWHYREEVRMVFGVRVRLSPTPPPPLESASRADDLFEGLS